MEHCGMQPVRIVRIDPFRALSSGKCDFETLMETFNPWQEAHNHLISRVLYGAPDFLWGEADGQCVWIWAVHDDVTAEDCAPYELVTFEGGMYAAAVCVDGDDASWQAAYSGILKWLETSSFAPDERPGHRTMCHMLNPSEELRAALGYDQTEIFVPIRYK